MSFVYPPQQHPTAVHTPAASDRDGLIPFSPPKERKRTIRPSQVDCRPSRGFYALRLSPFASPWLGRGSAVPGPPMKLHAWEKQRTRNSFWMERNPVPAISGFQVGARLEQPCAFWFGLGLTGGSHVVTLRQTRQRARNRRAVALFSSTLSAKATCCADSFTASALRSC